MASSSQSLDFSFDALRDFGSRLFRDRPNEARKLARNRGGDHGLQFPRMGELAISTAESLLGLPGYVSDWLAQLFFAQKEIAADKGLKPGAPVPRAQPPPPRPLAAPRARPRRAARAFTPGPRHQSGSAASMWA